MLTIDGSRGEGGGQILRSSLTLALLTRRPFRLTRIRAGRAKPGLMPQHLTAVSAAARIGAADVVGARRGSSELTFVPGPVRPGDYAFSVGTAGSTTLVLQTVLAPLLLATAASKLTLEGGTHNPHAPPFDFLSKVFLPVINRMGPDVAARLERPGFFPAGGGECAVSIRPAARLEPFELRERGPVRRLRACAKLARLPAHIAERELETIRKRLGSSELELELELEIEQLPRSRGPGNVVTIEIECEHITEICSAFGTRGRPAEEVGAQAAAMALRYLDADAPVGEHLADQLLLPLALAGDGCFRTRALTLHAETNLHVIEQFLGRRIEAEELPDGTTLVRARPASQRPGCADIDLV